ncbi:transmembrane protein 14 homolog [Ceratina calcarata]|uniref:Transmembrane protein 14 homolog n=1 Tax=Ceratina calcarata TaxID=156304 RepID=A0AAJ7J775_9HYME|nr:transmembrane protein 14 homolog [Ceratina calcarata]
MPADVLGYVYAAAVAAGGVLGYVKAQSIPSLGAGLAFGSVLGYGAYQTSEDPTNIRLSVAATLVLGGLMGVRYYSSGKMMPAGMLAILSTAMLIKTVVRSFTAVPMKTQ